MLEGGRGGVVDLLAWERKLRRCGHSAAFETCVILFLFCTHLVLMSLFTSSVTEPTNVAFQRTHYYSTRPLV